MFFLIISLRPQRAPVCPTALSSQSHSVSFMHLLGNTMITDVSTCVCVHVGYMTSKVTPAFLVIVQDYSKVNGAIHTATKISPTKLHVAHFVTQYTDLYVTQFYCRRVKVISFTPIAEVRPSLRRFLRNAQKLNNYVQICYV